VEGIVGDALKGWVSAILSSRIRLGRLMKRRPFGEVLKHGHLVALQPPLQSWTYPSSTVQFSQRAKGHPYSGV